MKKTPYSEKFFFVFIGLILLVMVALFFSACSKEWCNEKYPEPKNDSISYIEKLRVDTSYIPMPADSFAYEVPIDCPDIEIKADNKKNTVTAKIKDKVLTIKVFTKADTLGVLNWYHSTKEFKALTKTIEVVKIEYKTPKWAWYCLGAMIVLILWVTRKIWLNLIKISI
jgi:hypothetical protein